MIKYKVESSKEKVRNKEKVRGKEKVRNHSMLAPFSFLHSPFQSSARGFTLIELLMVIAIIGIISTLAVNKVGGVREASARKVSLANQIAVERAIESYLASNGRLNRLDSLVYTQGDTLRPWDQKGSEGQYGFNWTETNYTANVKSGLYLGPTEPSASAAGFRDEYNTGVTPGLCRVLCPYSLTPQQRRALSERLGLYHVMGHNEYAGDPAAYGQYKDQVCGDGTYVESRDGRNPNESGCVAIAVTNVGTYANMALMAVNPTIEAGRAIYRAFGQELMKTERDGYRYDERSAVAEANAKGGPLIALGLGPSANVIGKPDAGLESAPFATYPSRVYYANYILLFRLRPVGNTIVPEFAGVIDPCGNTIRAAREVIRNL